MMIRYTLLFFVVLTASLVSFGQNTGKLVLKKGEKYLIENKYTVLTSHEMMGQSMESKSDFFSSNNIEVKDSKDSHYDLINTFTKIKATVSAMGQDMNFDSDKKEDMEGEMGKSMRDIINQPKIIVVDKQGKVMMDKSDTAKKEQGGEMMSMMMQRFLGNQEESGFGVSEAFMIIPTEAKVGFNWTDSSSANGVKKSTTYTIKEIKGSDAVVAFSGILDTDTKTEMQGMEIGTKTNGKLAGEEVVDLKTGVIKQRTSTLESSGNMQVMGQEMPMKTKLSSVSTIKLM